MYFLVFLGLAFLAGITLLHLIAVIAVASHKGVRHRVRPDIVILLLASVFFVSIQLLISLGSFKVPEGKILVTDSEELFHEDVYHIYSYRRPVLIDMEYEIEERRIPVMSKNGDRFILTVDAKASWNKLEKEQLSKFRQSYGIGADIEDVTEKFKDIGFVETIRGKAEKCASGIESEYMNLSISGCIEHFLNKDKEELGFDDFSVTAYAALAEDKTSPQYYEDTKTCYEDDVSTVCDVSYR